MVLTKWMTVLIFIHRKRLGLCQNDCSIDVLKFSTNFPRFLQLSLKSKQEINCLDQDTKV